MSSQVSRLHEVEFGADFPVEPPPASARLPLEPGALEAPRETGRLRGKEPGDTVRFPTALGASEPLALKGTWTLPFIGGREKSRKYVLALAGAWPEPARALLFRGRDGGGSGTGVKGGSGGGSRGGGDGPSDPDDPDTRLLFSFYLSDQAAKLLEVDPRAAFALALDALEYFPENGAALVVVAHVFLAIDEIERADEATNALEHAAMSLKDQRARIAISWRANALHLRGRIEAARGQLDSSTAFFEAAVDQFRALEQPHNVAVVLGNCGRNSARGKDYTRAHAFFVRAFDAIEGRAGADAVRGVLLRNVAVVHALQGDRTLAIQVLREALDLFEELGGSFEIAVTNRLLGVLLHRHHKSEEAKIVWGQAAEIFATIDLPESAAQVRAWSTGRDVPRVFKARELDDFDVDL